MTQQKTYSLLAKLRRIPTEYEIATTAMLYYPKLGFEVETPLGNWYARYQKTPGRALVLDDWDEFVDPRATTYARYVELAAGKEAFVDGLWAYGEAGNYDARLADSWIAELESVMPVLRFPLHGLQMAAAYVGQMAPGGRVVAAAAFQAADEMRRITAIARRSCSLRKRKPDFGAGSRRIWEDEPKWQPLRKLIEELLVAYDFAEALAALCLAVKPAFDELFFKTWAERALGHGDEILAKAYYSFSEDGAWHGAWSTELARLLRSRSQINAALLDEHTAFWSEKTREALAPLR